MRDRAILETLYGTALRLGECRRLNVHDIDLQKGSLWVRSGKGRKDRLSHPTEGRPGQYLSDPKEKSARSRRVELGMVLDFNKDGTLIGIELLAPQKITLEAINKILEEHGQEPLKESDLAPILAA